MKCAPEHLFFHIVAILHAAPAYPGGERRGNCLSWPAGSPLLPAGAAVLRAGAELGEAGRAALLDPETPVPGVTDLKVRADLKGWANWRSAGCKTKAPT
ncbi:MAG: hypothetical protein R3F11_09500 [Verrucomicrobiales bacterium]